MTAEMLIIAALATWRITSLLVFERGPGDVFTYLRTLAGRWQTTAEVVGCPWCLSVYVGCLCAALAFTTAWWIMLPFALSAVSVIVERTVRERAHA